MSQNNSNPGGSKENDGMVYARTIAFVIAGIGALLSGIGTKELLEPIWLGYTSMVFFTTPLVIIVVGVLIMAGGWLLMFLSKGK